LCAKVLTTAQTTTAKALLLSVSFGTAKIGGGNFLAKIISFREVDE
jgi:hypothetical protein